MKLKVVVFLTAFLFIVSIFVFRSTFNELNLTMNNNLSTAENILYINQEFIKMFQVLLKDTRKHRRDCNIAKSVGTGVAVVGSGLAVAGVVVATVATGGIALAVIAPVLGWTGFGVGIVGSVTTFSTELADTVITSTRRKEIEGLQQNLKSQLDRAPAFVHNITKLKETESSSSETVFNGVATLGNNGLRLWAATGHLAKAANYSTTGGFILTTCGRNPSVGKIVCKCVTKSPVFLASVANLIATGAELYFLYKSWTTPHALEKVICDLIEKIQNLNDTLKWFMNSFDSRSDCPDFTNQCYEFSFERN